MKQSVRVCVIVAVVTAASIAQVSAQPAADEWSLLVAPYLMGAAMGGKTTVRGLDVDVDLSASDVFSNLQFGAMGSRRMAWRSLQHVAQPAHVAVA